MLGTLINDETQTPPPNLHQLGPMTIGGMLDRSVQIYRQGFKIFFAIGLISQVQSLIQVFTIGGSDMKNADLTGWIIFAALIPVTILLAMWASAATIDHARRIFLGYGSTLKEVAACGRRYLWRVLGTTILYGLFMGALLLLCGGVGFVAFLAIDSFSMLAKVLLMSALAILGLGIFLYYAVAYLLYTQVIVLENLWGTKSLVRSRVLMRERTEKGILKNNVFRVSILLLGILFLQMVVWSLPMLLNGIIALGTLNQTSIPELNIFAGILSYLAQCFAMPFSIIAMTVFYYDIRIRFEGLDLLWKAQK